MDFNSCHKANVSYQNSASGDITGPGNEISDLPDFCLSVHISFANEFFSLLVLDLSYFCISERHCNLLRNVAFPMMHRAALGSLSAHPEWTQGLCPEHSGGTHSQQCAYSSRKQTSSKYVSNSNIFILIFFLIFHFFLF